MAGGVLAESFVWKTRSAGFDGVQALEMIHRRYTIDYASRKAGSKPASSDDVYYPVFHLDMLSAVGRPLRPIASRSERIFDNVTVTFQRWGAQYSSKHTTSSLTFDLAGRTFRFATGATREVWFIVMHPLQTPIRKLPQTTKERRQRGDASAQRSAMERHHAEVMASYIKDQFLDGELLGEGIEPSWKLDGSQSQTISYNKWATFQELFMEGWPAFAAQYAHDPFWVENEPAFHAYDHGANTFLEISDALPGLPRETRLRSDEDSEDSEEESGGDESSSRGSDDDGVDSGRTGRSGRRSLGSETAARGRRNASGDGDDNSEPDPQLFGGAIQELRSELEQKYQLENIDRFSYALAVDINCLDATEQTPVCLLADRKKVAGEYGNRRDFTFYPLAFHPRYGNYSSTRPPAFLSHLCAIMRENASYKNEGADVVSFGYFQAYSNIKRVIRHRPEDLLATKGIATAALTLPPAEANAMAHARDKQQRLLSQLRGDRTPGTPETSTPFARERQRLEAAIDKGEFAFRMEQVVTVVVSRLLREHLTFATVLQPIFQLMRFFLVETGSYIPTLRRFQPSMFPATLGSFARVFELAFREMQGRFHASSDNGLGVALSEGIAALDRLGNFCFTGDARVLPTTVLGPLGTTESLHKAAWPFISPDMLDLREKQGLINAEKWPRDSNRQPILMHIASLAFHYGQAVAASRQSHLRFGEMGSGDIRHLSSAVRFMEEVFQELWIPQTVSFVAYQLRRRINQGRRGQVGSGDQTEQLNAANAVVDKWVGCNEPFSWKCAFPPPGSERASNTHLTGD
jgi:hypothetical protein